MTDARALEAAATRQNGLASFFERERRRAARRSGLPLALLSSGGLRYLFGRGAALFARVPLRTGLYAAEIIVFADFLELGLFGAFLAIRSVMALFGAFHWGALEPLRRTVREETARGDVPAAERAVLRYLRLAIDLCIFELFVLIAWLEFGPRPFGGFSILDAFAIGCGVRAMSETVLRTYHAGAFALRRVRRPFATLFAVDVVEAGVPLLLWPWLGPWGFALGQLAGAGAECVFTLHYTRKTYRQLAVSAPTLRRVLSERHAEGSLGLVRGMLGPGVGNLVSQVDAVLITVLAFGTSPEGLALAAGLHVLRPVLSLGSGWARVFYFDLARLDGPVRRLFRQRFERLLVRAAPLYALLATATALLIGAVLSWSAPLPGWLALVPLLWFVPFLIARSFYAVAQIRAFVNGAYTALGIGAGVAVLLVAVGLAAGADGPVALVTATAALVLAALAFRSNLGARPAEQDLATPEKLARPFAFLARLRALDSPVAVTVALLNPRSGARTVNVVQALAALPSVDFAARWGRRLLLIASSSTKPLAASLVAASAGTLLEIAALPRARGGPDALAALLDGDFLGIEGEGRAPSGRELAATFAARFPNGTMVDAGSGTLPAGGATPLELSRTLGEVAALASGVRPSRRRGVRAAVYAPGGQARLVFFAGRDADPGAFAEFERLAFRASVAATREDEPSR